MKKTIIATILTGAMVLGMTACGTNPTETTATPTEPTTVESTTEATTSETTAETTETTQETTKETTKAIAFTPEQALGLNPDTGITEINIGDATIETQNFDGVEYPMAPNYVEGQDIVITFKCDADLKLTRAFKYSPDIGFPIDEAILMWEITDGRDITFDMSKIIDNCTLTNADGVYTFTIPAEFVNSNYYFYVEFDNGAIFNLRCFA